MSQASGFDQIISGQLSVFNISQLAWDAHHENEFHLIKSTTMHEAISMPNPIKNIPIIDLFLCSIRETMLVSISLRKLVTAILFTSQWSRMVPSMVTCVVFQSIFHEYEKEGEVSKFIFKLAGGKLFIFHIFS